MYIILSFLTKTYNNCHRNNSSKKYKILPNKKLENVLFYRTLSARSDIIIKPITIKFTNTL